MTAAISGHIVTAAEYAAANAPRAAATGHAPTLAEYAEYVRANWRTWTPAQCAAAGTRITQLKRKA